MVSILNSKTIRASSSQNNKGTVSLTSNYIDLLKGSNKFRGGIGITIDFNAFEGKENFRHKLYNYNAAMTDTTINIKGIAKYHYIKDNGDIKYVYVIVPNTLTKSAIVEKNIYFQYLAKFRDAKIASICDYAYEQFSYPEKKLLDYSIEKDLSSKSNLILNDIKEDNNYVLIQIDANDDDVELTLDHIIYLWQNHYDSNKSAVSGGVKLDNMLNPERVRYLLSDIEDSIEYWFPSDFAEKLARGILNNLHNEHEFRYEYAGGLNNNLQFDLTDVVNIIIPDYFYDIIDLNLKAVNIVEFNRHLQSGKFNKVKLKITDIVESMNNLCQCLSNNNLWDKVIRLDTSNLQ